VFLENNIKKNWQPPSFLGSRPPDQFKKVLSAVLALHFLEHNIKKDRDSKLLYKGNLPGVAAAVQLGIVVLPGPSTGRS